MYWRRACTAPPPLRSSPLLWRHARGARRVDFLLHACERIGMRAEDAAARFGQASTADDDDSLSRRASISRKIRVRWHTQPRNLYSDLWTITVGLARSLARCGNFIPFPFTCRLLGWTMKERLEYRNYIASRLYPWTTLGWITPRYRASLLAASVVRIEHLNYDSFSNCCYYIAVCSMLQLPKWPEWY